MSEIYCKYCYKYWKLKREYDKHIICCEFFYNLRKNPTMENYGGKVPTIMELTHLVSQLMTKVDKQEKEIARLKACVNSKQKRVILDLLNNPSQMPVYTFEQWWRLISVNEIHLQRVFKYDLTEGIKLVLENFLDVFGKTQLPIRCFSQKQNIFYVYVQDTNSDKKTWKMMVNAEFDTMILYLSQLFLREFLRWQKENMNCDDDENEDKKAQELNYMIKINGMKTSSEKRNGDLKKWLFPLLEENAKNVDVDFE